MSRRCFSTGQVRGIVAGMLVSLAGGFSAHGALASLDQLRPPEPAPAAPTGYEADDHFPGALYFELARDGDGPAAGATGTTDLPTRPGDAVLATGDASIHPALPFRLSGNTRDGMRARQCLTSAVYYEAAREPDAGQRAVAQVVLNRVRHPAFPDTVCGVVYQGSEKAGCQFSFACDGSLARAPEHRYWLRAETVADDALSGHVFAPVGLATHYHTYAVTPAWNRKLVMTGVFGAHFFHRWQGWWGTSAAFRERYAGGEPEPGPHRGIETPSPAAVAATTDVRPVADAAPQGPPGAPSPKATPGPDRIKPQYADSGTASAALPESRIREKWKDSGTALR